MMKRSLPFLLICLLTIAGSVAFGQSWNQAQELEPIDPAPLSNYGISVDVSGPFAIIGANHNSYDETGGAFLSTAGAAYIRQQQVSGNWTTIAKLVASDREANDLFGSTVSITGNYAIVGAHQRNIDTLGPTDLKDAGAVYSFTQSGPSAWTQNQQILSNEPDDYDLFGKSVSSAGSILVVGAPGEQLDATGGAALSEAGAVYVYRRNNVGIWEIIQKIVAPDRALGDNFGMVVYTDGHTIVVGAPNEDEDATGGSTVSGAGSVYVFEKNIVGTFDFLQKIVSPDRGVDDGFGSAVSVETDFLVIGAPFHDYDMLGGSMLADAGAIYFFDRSPTAWTSPQKFTPVDRAAGDNFGFSVSVNDFYAVASSPFNIVFTPGTAGEQSGAAYIFNREIPAGWNLETKVYSADYSDDDFFGGAVSIDQNHIIVGAQDKTIDPSGSPITSAGTSFLFELCAAPVMESMTICEGDSVFLGGDWQIGAGTYIDTYSAGFGCDTTVETTLSVTDVDESISVGSIGLLANNSLATAYQWIDCSTGLDIPGATSQSYEPTTSGDYAVRITDGACTRESACESYVKTGLVTPSDLGWSVYPNPFAEYLVLENAGSSANGVQVRLTDLSGRLVYRSTLNGSKNILQLEGLSSGVYFLQLTLTDGTQASLKLVK